MTDAESVPPVSPAGAASSAMRLLTSFSPRPPPPIVDRDLFTFFTNLS